MSGSNPLLDAALAYAAKRYSIFPVHTILADGRCSCLNDGCKSPGKHPRIREWPELATTDEQQIREWWSKWPEANIGLPTDGLFVVDIDGEGNPWPGDPEKAADLARAPTSQTPHGGRHHLFLQPFGREWGSSTGKIAPHVDVRANGGYILAPPSTLRGKEYRWVEGHGLECGPIDLPMSPDWLSDIADGIEEARSAPAPVPVPIQPIAMSDDAIERRAVAYLNALPPAISGHGGHNATYAAAMVIAYGFDIHEERAFELLLAHYNPRCIPPWTEQELRHKVQDAVEKPHGRPRGWLRDQPLDLERGVDLSALLASFSVASIASEAPSGAATSDLLEAPPQRSPRSLRQLVVEFPRLRSPVIEGILRQGETMNVISAPKLGKSFLVIDLALSIATGRHWLGMPCVPGEVLIVDNELHSETSANRIPKVAEARGIAFEDVADRLYVENLRGSLMNFETIGPYLKQFAPGRFKVVILDAFYRFLPPKADENDNGMMANLFNGIDAFADYLKCSFVLIHHSSKGSQSFKEITDVGSGAGTMSRATDTHLILRRHEASNAVVLESSVRSWPPNAPRCLRWEYPLWVPADDLDPSMLRQDGKRRAKGGDESSESELTLDQFVEKYVGKKPRLKMVICADANAQDINDHKVGVLLAKAEATGLIFRRRMENGYIGFSTEPALPSEPEPIETVKSKRQAVVDLLQAEPELATAGAAERCGVTERYVRQIRKEQEGGPDEK